MTMGSQFYFTIYSLQKQIFVDGWRNMV